MNLRVILPESIVALIACLLFVVEPFVPREKKDRLCWLALAALVLSAAAILPLLPERGVVFAGAFAYDLYAYFFKFLALGVTALIILVSVRYLPGEGIRLGEYYGFLLFATVGMMILPSAVDLLTFYLGLELMSVSLYILAAFAKRDARSMEAGIKYFITGVFTSGLILYGIALLYGLTGSTRLAEISTYLAEQNLLSNPALILAVILLLAGFGFKIAAVPFHMWAPDVYEGSLTSVTAFLSAGSKAAAFSALARVLFTGLGGARPYWGAILWLLAVLTMTVGNVLALVQDSVKRMLAYSSIAHAGYILIGFAVASRLGLAAVLVYLVVYAFVTAGTFSMILLLARQGFRAEEIEDFSGLGRAHPFAAAAFVIFALSLIGIPPTGGFVGKLYLFGSAIEAGQASGNRAFYWLAVIGVLNSVISLYYYFRIVVAMYMQEPKGEILLNRSAAMNLALVLMVSATLAIGLYPEPLFRAAFASVSIFR